jgi:hypothetical protein
VNNFSVKIVVCVCNVIPSFVRRTSIPKARILEVDIEVIFGKGAVLGKARAYEYISK